MKSIKNEIGKELEELSIDFLLSQVTESPEPEVDWGKSKGEEIW